MKTIIITGAAGNLGTAVVEKFLASGYTVAATVLNDTEKERLGRREHLTSEVVDLTNETAARDFVNRTIAQHENVYGVLMLVGGFAMGDLLSTTHADIQKQIDLNFTTAYHIAQPVYQHLKEKGEGRLVFVGARPALLSSAGKQMIAYSLSKSLLFKLSELINADAKGTNVTSTVIVPSTIDTPQNRQSMPQADPEKWVKPEAIADVLEFLISEQSAVLRESVVKVYNNA